VESALFNILSMSVTGLYKKAPKRRKIHIQYKIEHPARQNAPILCKKTA